MLAYIIFLVSIATTHFWGLRSRASETSPLSEVTVFNFILFELKYLGTSFAEGDSLSLSLGFFLFCLQAFDVSFLASRYVPSFVHPCVLSKIHTTGENQLEAPGAETTGKNQVEVEAAGENILFALLYTSLSAEVTKEQSKRACAHALGVTDLRQWSVKSSQ